jgi:hypothetical protein
MFFILTPTQKENMMTIIADTRTISPLIELQSTQPLPALRTRSKPRFLDLINLHHVSMWRIAKTAHVPINVLHSMLYNVPVNALAAVQVLAAFRQLTGTTYTLNDVAMQLIPASLFGEIAIS